jgi:hypothetical protein
VNEVLTPFNAASPLVQLDVIGKLVTLSEREAEELRAVAAADAGRSTTRRDLSLLLDRDARGAVEVRQTSDLVTGSATSWVYQCGTP